MSLRVNGVNKYFLSNRKEVHTLNRIDLEIKKGEFVCIVGPSGCGKSTLLNIIAGLEKPSEGKVIIDGGEVTEAGNRTTVIFQDSALFPWLNVVDNVEFGMKMAGISKRERRERALKYLKMVHLSQFQNSYIHELSGGMRQRVAIARALAFDSEILLMDEPFAALDYQTRNILQMELQQIWFETKKTIIFVTHNVEEAVLLADRVLLMTAGPGKIKKEYRIQLARPRQLENKDFTYVASAIMKELREEVEKVAKSEYDSDWNIETDTILPNTSNDMGVGI